ncbi:MAG: DUF3237 domain-containing protein [Actinomycetota bacterium]|nr:DUF3237 domain-containing protein [Actinomycetota bacterium]
MSSDVAKPPELVPLCRVDLELGPPSMIGKGASGQRVIVDVLGMTLTGDRLNGTLRGQAADCLTVVGTTATIDVRARIETDDGALVYVQYRGRSDVTDGVGAAPMYVAPLFETGDERYQWLNHIQAVGKGLLSELRYDWFELR